MVGRARRGRDKRAVVWGAADGRASHLCARVRRVTGLPGTAKAFVDAFLEDVQIAVHFSLSKTVWEEAGEAYRAYAEHRRNDRAGQPKRLPVDFLVGAHAFLSADRLLTLDPARCRTACPALFAGSAA